MVVEKFGRYSHRNIIKGRASTQEEKAWLADVDNLPEWAKSQLPQQKQAKEEHCKCFVLTK